MPLLVGLSDRGGTGSTLSGGMKRRANLAAAILHSPDLLLLDEPTVGIDAQSRNLILENLKTLRENGATIVYTTHYMEEAESLCERVVIMDCGKIIAEGPRDPDRRHGRVLNLEESFLRLTEGICAIDTGTEMTTLLATIRKELLELRRDRAGILVLLVMPMTLVLIVVAGAGQRHAGDRRDADPCPPG
jgi:ABC-type multidrug transport system ATPase subunit